MSADTISAFVATAEEHHATVHRVPPDAVAGTVDDLIDPPAVGVRLPDGPELPDAVATDPTPGELDAANTGVTAASLAVADYGTVVLEADAAGSEAVSLFPERHVVILRTGDVVTGMREAMSALGDRLRDGASAVLATGPSATADMGDLVIGAHGPREVEVVLVESDSGGGERMPADAGDEDVAVDGGSADE
ncbi:LutC/YkgG family protein [Halobaculum gomorrense]|uniref:L-lactate dehydrogenase complex protein LldG n=1 Tax=Halobaculum gomorrense TaxID=43928 RepID=A0A1M5RNJ5_9EURY|nr:LUD domain-containing protein [Halobaculum gomorrense]SHH27854.1 L-lactate dehydrogenase complex protein LldG [Halobaculum gomorrense]